MHIFIEFLFLNKRHCLIHTSCGVCRSAVCAFWVFGIPEHTLQNRNFCNPETEIKIYTTKLRGWQNLGVIFAVWKTTLLDIPALEVGSSYHRQELFIFLWRMLLSILIISEKKCKILYQLEKKNKKSSIRKAIYSPLFKIKSECWVIHGSG